MALVDDPVAMAKGDEKVDAKKEGAVHRFQTYGDVRLSGVPLEMIIAQGDFKTVVLQHANIMHTCHCPDLAGTRSAVASLEGDFHTQMAVGNQHSNIFNKDLGKSDAGTYQGLRLAINRCNVKLPWKNAFAANEQFLYDLRGVHSTGMVMAVLGIESPKHFPKTNPPPRDKRERRKWFEKLVLETVQRYWSWEHDWTEDPKPAPTKAELEERARKELLFRHYCSRGCGRHYKLRYGKEMEDHIKTCKYEGTDQRPEGWADVVRDDCKYNYHVQSWNMEMFYGAFHHHIQFGDCPRIVNFYAAIGTIARKNSNHAHYATAALFARAMITIMLSPRNAHRMTWGRLCCNHDKEGHNIGGDRRLEHVNLTCKVCLSHLGHMNMTDKQVNTIGRAGLPLHDIGRAFDRRNGVPIPSNQCSF